MYRLLILDIEDGEEVALIPLELESFEKCVEIGKPFVEQGKHIEILKVEIEVVT